MYGIAGMEYRRRSLSEAWDDPPVSLDERLEQTFEEVRVCICHLPQTCAEVLRNLTRSIFGCQRVERTRIS